MSLVTSQAGPSGRAGELALWSVAGLLMLSVHIGAAALLIQETPDAPADNSPPAAIMIELAPEPEAVNTEEDQISPDQLDQEEVKSEQAEPVEEPQPEPTPEPVEQQQKVAEPVEPTPAEPVIEEPPPEMPEPEPQITRIIPEPPPEPVEEIDPIEEQMTAALENVEVPLPMMRPELPKPDEVKKPEPRREQAKRSQKPKQQQQQQARQDMAEAKVQARQSDRTAASQNSTGFFSQSISPAKWMTRVRTKIARYARKCPGNGTGIVTVRFSFDGSGNIGSVSVSRSSGDSAIDNYVTSAVRRASPIPAPPSGVASFLSQPVKCE
ncbi:TonB family protein [Neorhizobium petrolearium]|uniref:TonB family protein n=1 Tax=Neorhizobium petrolearium TaxID=515361 RepID=UPI003F7DF5B9